MSDTKEIFSKFHSRTVHLDIIKYFYLPTDAQENCFKNNIKIYIKTAPTCFGAVTIMRERVTLAQIISSLMMVRLDRNM
jgi:hypothetical protein